MKTFFLFLFLFLFSLFCFSQTSPDSIEIKHRLGKIYFQYGKRLNTQELYSVLNSVNESAGEVKKAKLNLIPLYIFSYSGGFMLGWTLGSAIAGGSPQWWLPVTGVGLILCAIPFQIGYNRHIYKAVVIYNSGLRKIGIRKPVLEIGFYNNGFKINF